MTIPVKNEIITYTISKRISSSAGALPKAKERLTAKHRGNNATETEITRDQMITAAMNLIEERGYESLTARELGKYLGSSSCPIFTLFKDMDELKTEVKNRAVEIFNEYMAVAEEFYPAYKKRGMQWVKFASEQPRLFRLLFMQETSGQADFDAAQKIIPFGKQNDIDIIMRDYNASREQAERLFRQMWIYSYGLCSLVASKVCVFSEKEIARNLGEIFNGMIYVIKSDNPELTSIMPADADSDESDNLAANSPDLSK